MVPTLIKHWLSPRPRSLTQSPKTSNAGASQPGPSMGSHPCSARGESRKWRCRNDISKSDRDRDIHMFIHNLKVMASTEDSDQQLCGFLVVKSLLT